MSISTSTPPVSTSTALSHRSAAAVFWLSVVTFGIYSIVWYAKTRGELKRSGTPALSTWLLIVPFGIYFYLWSLSAGIEKVTKISAVENFFLMLLLGAIGQTIVQSRINKV